MQTIKQGSKGQDVKTLQLCLHLQADGIWGKLTTESFLQWQKQNHLTADGICGQKSWALLQQQFPQYFSSVGSTTSSPTLKQGAAIPLNLNQDTYLLSKSTRKINDIIIHCTATKEGQDYTVAQIKQWHVLPVSKGGRGWSDIGYHYIIYRDGSVHVGRPVNTSGAHCTNHNSNSIGIVYVGGCPKDTTAKAKDTRTPEQQQSLLRLTRQLMSLYGLTKAQVHGHHEYDKGKACPSFDMPTFRAALG